MAGSCTLLCVCQAPLTSVAGVLSRNQNDPYIDCSWFTFGICY